MATFKAYPNGGSMGRGNNAPVGGARGKVDGWSRASVQRHLQWLYGSCHRCGNCGAGHEKHRFTTPESTGNAANSLLANKVVGGVVGAPSEGAPLISSYISARSTPNGFLPKTSENKNDPRETAISGGQITKAARA